MNNEELYIDYLMDQRVRRKTNKPDKLHQIYSNKYANWVIPFLNEHGILEVPPLIFCNTLYRLPDYFGLEGKFFFLFDYYLYDYIYDLNYSLYEDENNEYMFNLWIKVYMENLYLRDNIDMCYKFCITTPDLESYKKSEKYKNHDLMYRIVELSDVQEAVILLHEASHFFYENYNLNVKKSSTYKEVVEIFCKYRQKYQYDISLLKMISESEFDTEGLLEECYCDSESIKFVLKEVYKKLNINKKDLFIQIFRTILSVYFLHYIMSITERDKENYNDYHMQQLTYRLGNMYLIILSFLAENDGIEYKELLDSVYIQQVEQFASWGRKMRQFSGIIKDELKDFDMEEVEDEKKETIKEYLALL
ncbi:MAG: hypothetical protein K2N63_15515 [Lachnospiraceae bacterium]|nr:hypothetical protein [Lachnospiraceae bacterium]